MEEEEEGKAAAPPPIPGYGPKMSRRGNIQAKGDIDHLASFEMYR